MQRSALRELLKLTARPEMISFAGGLPAAELFPVEQVRQAADAVLGRKGGQALQYGETEGLGELRDWIAAKFSRPNLSVSRSNVIVVSGAQQGLDLIGRVLLSEGDGVIVENPTYLAALSAWRPLGVRFLAVRGDADGLRVDELDTLLVQRPKLLYTVPNFQNPQGTTLSAERRGRLVALLREHDVGLIEDNPYGELRYEGAAPPNLLDLDAGIAVQDGSGSNVVYVGTFSKVLAPGLRVGWVIAPSDVVEKLVQAKQAADLHTSSLSQHIVCELLKTGVFERQIPLLCAAYGERRDRMLAALERCFPTGAAWTRPAGGMFLLVTLPGGVDAGALLERALLRQVAFVPGREFHLDGQGRSTLRLNFSNAGPEQIDEGIRRLGELLDETQ